jgi:putative ATP-dependent endonuclease of the OLD family
MLIRKIVVQNVRSFLDRAELSLDGLVSIVIGPNGGGKTNLLDAAVVMLRRYLFASMYAAPNPTPEQPTRHDFRPNDALNNMILEKHSKSDGRDQIVEVTVEVTTKDLDNMRSMKGEAARLTELANKKYFNFDLTSSASWQIEAIPVGTQFVYSLVNGNLGLNGGEGAASFLRYLQTFEMDGRLREEYDLAPLSNPLIYLPVNRASQDLQSTVELASYNEFESKRQSDATSSRMPTRIVNLAVGRMAQRFRLLLERDKGVAAIEFRNDPNLKELTRLLHDLGYEWSLETIDALKNRYDVQLRKQGSSFLVGAASSGEKELLTYLFAIFSLNVRDALIIVDEPELHLHPKWQKTLIRLFIELSQSTGNQFLLATHSPTFVSPESIQYVSRVFSRDQRSHILRLNTAALPEAKHLLSIVNSQNNERLFFADEVVLVEGLSDRIVFEAILDKFGRADSARRILEVVDVGGKGLFEAYASVLRACQIEYSIIADLDYVEQVGTADIKSLFKVDTREIKTDVVDNTKSRDGDAIVAAIDDAIATESWAHASDVWEYIKSRRRALRIDVSPEQRLSLDAFVNAKHLERLHLLRLGELEDYLPLGNRSKDIDKLIRFLGQDGWWEALPELGRAELERIALALLPQRSPPMNGAASVQPSKGA